MPSNKNKLTALAREQFGKGAARKLRAAGQTPAVLYGHGNDPQHLSVEAHPLSLIVRQSNALIELDIDGKKQLALVKDVQKDPVRQIIEHVDLLIVKKGETVEVEIPIIVEGESFSGTAAMQELNYVLVNAPAISIPEHFVLDVEGLEEGTQLFVSDIQLPEGVEMLTEAEELVVNVIVPTVDTESDADSTDEEATEEAATEEAESEEDSE